MGLAIVTVDKLVSSANSKLLSLNLLEYLQNSAYNILQFNLIVFIY